MNFHLNKAVRQILPDYILLIPLHINVNQCFNRLCTNFHIFYKSIHTNSQSLIKYFGASEKVIFQYQSPGYDIVSFSYYVYIQNTYINYSHVMGKCVFAYNLYGEVTNTINKLVHKLFMKLFSIQIDFSSNRYRYTFVT